MFTAKDGTILSDADLAYAAGFMDGEGCVNAVMHNSGTIHIRVLVVNTDLHVLEHLKAKFGGDIATGSNHKKHVNWRKSYQWRVARAQAVEFLNAIHPWLRIKLYQAQVAFAWDAIRSKKRGVHVDADEKAVHKFLYDELKFLNMKGKRTRKLSPVDREMIFYRLQSWQPRLHLDFTED